LTTKNSIMKLKKLILSALALLAFATYSSAQDKEFGVFLGTTEYQGDLSKNAVDFKEIKPGFGILGRYYFGPRFDVQGGLNYGFIGGNDANNYTGQNMSGDAKDLVIRNLNFHSNIFEISARAELNLLPYISNSKRYKFAPYLFAGVALYHFNPKATYDGVTEALQPLHTEGEGLPGGPANYSLWQFAIPYGIGVKYSLGNFWNIGLELGERKLFTDYLDDVSNNGTLINFANPYVYSQLAGQVKTNPFTPGAQRGDSGKDDTYLFVGFTITKTIRNFPCTNF
jgi:hypothetical protein